MTTSPATGPARPTMTPPARADLAGSRAFYAERMRNVATRVDLDRGAALGYARSANDHISESIERQVDGIRSVVAARGLSLVEVYVDREVSGARGDRKALSKMLDFLRSSARRPATVIVESADRLARDVTLFVTLWDELKELGVALHDVSNGAISETSLRSTRSPARVRGTRGSGGHAT